MQSDPTAIQTMQAALQQSGGIYKWRGIHSAEMRVTIPPHGKSAPVTLLLLDDWSTLNTKYRRGFVGKTKTPKDHNGAASFNSKADGTGMTVPEFDQARVLADHLPAAAIEVILRRPEYVVKQSAPGKCPAESLCVDVYRQSYPQGPFVKEQEWIISTASGLPASVQYRLPNLLHSGIETWGKITYKAYSTSSGLQVPSDVEIDIGSGMKMESQLQSLNLNVPFDTKHFDQEIAQ
jgi:hypothetical protein